MWFKVFLIGLLACAVLSITARAEDHRMVNVVDPSDEHPWGGDNFTGDPVGPDHGAPIITGTTPQTAFIQLAFECYWIRITGWITTTSSNSGKTDAGNYSVQPPSRTSETSTGAGNQ